MTTQLFVSSGSENESLAVKDHLVFFITGNPGLVSYYDTFLRTLHHLLAYDANSIKSDKFHIYGESLMGYGDNDSPSLATGRPYSLEEQIEDRLQSLTGQRIRSGPRKGQQYDSVTLIGHSLGTYILFEILNRLQKDGSSLKVRAGILLMPTVIGLAESSSGLKFGSLVQIPGLISGGSFLAKALLWPIPKSALKWLVKAVLRMPDAGAEVTTNFLKSSMGIWQALYLAKDELETITIDKWDEDIWGIEHKEGVTQKEIPRLYFYFAEDDHWIANHTRDWLITARGRGEHDIYSTKPTMVIDTNGIGHDFCIRHSETVAEKVKVWIDESMQDGPQ